MLRSMCKNRLGSWVLLSLVLAWAVAALLVPTSVVFAQSDLDAAKTATDAPAPAPAPAPADAGATAAPAAAAPTAPAAPKQSLLGFFYAALGPRYVVVFLALSFTFVAVTVMCFLSVRRDVLMPAALIEGFEAHLNEKRYQEAYELAKSDESYLGKVLSAGLGKLSAGYDQAIEAMQEVMDDETMKLEHRISYVAMIGTLAPMFGLLGT
ncbi:MAG: MotA/TolQ/ExbB proton channel family protein, partial [Planctomycetaceae bacterium]|nr:MotA/TolQ/ExbB proton channel family protein [Planctomycetaceae bacterium]